MPIWGILIVVDRDATAVGRSGVRAGGAHREEGPRAAVLCGITAA